MTALARDASREKRGIGRVFHYPVKANAILYKGAIVTIDVAGFAIAATDVATNKVAGVAIEKVDATGFADGDKWIRVDADCEFLFAASSITQAMVGALMVIVDDNTVDDAAGATNDISVGKLTQFVSTTSGWVYVPGLTSIA